MGKQLAFVLGGGGARGALQVGALQALHEHGYSPDLLVGTSSGAINAAFLGIHGLTSASLDELAAAWQKAADLDLLPANYIRMALRSMLRPSLADPSTRIRDFLVEHGVSPKLRFGDIDWARLIMVSSDLNTGKPVLHGECLDDTVLDALLASTTLPPWSMPVRRQGKYLMDGAVLSSLPIEPALRMGATEVIALDLMDTREPFGPFTGFGVLLSQIAGAVEQRQVDLELELAKARNVPVYYLCLTARDLVPIWDFGHTAELIEQGYEIAARDLEQGRGIENRSSGEP